MQNVISKLGSWKLWAAAGLSAGLLELPFPLAGPLPVWRSVFAWFALVPLLWALLSPACVEQARPLRRGFLLGYLCGVLWFGGNCYWVRDTMKQYGDMPLGAPTLLLLAFSLYLGLYFGLFGFCVVLVRNATGSTRWALAAVPFLWVAMELAAARITSFPWDQLGYSQVDYALLTRLAPWTGVYGISFVLVAANALLAGGFLLDRCPSLDLAHPYKELRAPSLRLIPGARVGNLKPISGRISGWFWGIAGIVLLTAGMAGNLLSPPKPAPTATAVLIQPNLNVSGDNRWLRPGEWESHIADFQRLAGEQCKTYIAGIPQTGAPAGEIVCPPTHTHPDLIAWPESPAPMIDNDPRFQQALVSIARQQQTPLVVGAIGVSLAEPEQGVAPGGYRIYNSALVVGADGARVGRYDKIHLVPFGEYIPFRRLIFFAHALTGNVGETDRGTERKVFRLNGHRYGVFLCYESVFADEVRQFAQLGAEVLVNLSDDGWYGDTSAPWQHLNMARMRAIENRRWLLRDTNNGVTAVIDPYGRVRQSIPRHQADALHAGYGFRSDVTFYTAHGDIFAYLCAVLAMCSVGWSARKLLRQSVGLWKHRAGVKDSESFIRNLRDDDRQERLKAE
jgi:apolipoprotein N-acyltransferase